VDPRAVLEQNAADLENLLAYSYEYRIAVTPKSAWLPTNVVPDVTVEEGAVETPMAEHCGTCRDDDQFAGGTRVRGQPRGAMSSRTSEKRKRMLTPVKKGAALSRSPFVPPSITPQPKKRVPRADPVSNYHRMSQMRSAQEKMRQKMARQARDAAAELEAAAEPDSRVHYEKPVHASLRPAWH